MRRCGLNRTCACWKMLGPLMKVFRLRLKFFEFSENRDADGPCSHLRVWRVPPRHGQTISAASGRDDGAPHSAGFQNAPILVEHHDAVLDKEQIMEAVWPDSIVEENNLAQAISKLRQVFGEPPGTESYIVTVPGRGYRFVAEVNKRTHTPGTPDLNPNSQLSRYSRNTATTEVSQICRSHDWRFLARNPRRLPPKLAGCGRYSLVDCYRWLANAIFCPSSQLCRRYRAPGFSPTGAVVSAPARQSRKKHRSVAV